MKIFLHIGWHKTGTTAIQRMLFQHRVALRERLRVDYPDSARRKIAHAPLAWSLAAERGKADPGELVAKLKAEVRARGLERCIVSSEVFSMLRPERVEQLAALLREDEVRVIGYVRRQDQYLESRYNQMVKFAPVRLAVDFPEFVARQVQAGPLDLERCFAAWAAAFGKPALCVRLYDRGALPQGDVRRDFCAQLGMPVEAFTFPDAESNQSLDYESVCFLRHLNAVPMSRELHARVVKRLRKLNAGKEQSGASFFTPRERAAFLERFRESNRRFAREFLGREDALEPRGGELDLSRGPREYGDEEFFATFDAVFPKRLAGGAERPRGRSRLRQQARGSRAA